MRLHPPGLEPPPPEFMGEDGAAHRDSTLHRLDEDLAAAFVECGKAAAFHERTLLRKDRPLLRARRERP
jgi:hypothetical protein